MTSIAQLSDEVISLLNENQAAVLAWASNEHYQQVVAQAEEHLLVRVKARFDFSPLEKACAAFHRYAGQRGQAATHTVGQLCRGLVVKALNHWSYRQTADEIASNSLVRWFVGYALGEATLSYSTLQRFAEWVITYQPRLFFTEILQQIDADFPAEAQAPQIGDTFALYSRAHAQSRMVMVRRTCQALLYALAAVTPLGHTAVCLALDWVQLFGAEDELPEAWLDKEERLAGELRSAVGAQQCLTLVQAQLQALTPSPSPEWTMLTEWLALLQKVLTDYFVFTVTAEQPLQATVRSEAVKGSYRIGSTVDPEATFRQHRDTCDLGYNISLAATTHFVREIAAATGATPDSSGVALLVSAQKEHLGTVPPKLIYDRAAGMPKIFAEVDKASDGQTQLVARLIDHTKNNPRFGPSAFTLDQQGHLHCPNGQSTDRAYRSGSADGWNYRFKADQCQGCPLWDKCRDPQSKPSSHRQVFISDYLYQQREAIAYTKTPAFQADMKLRPQIERIIACLTRYHGARYATALGRQHADFQVRMAALAFNLKQWVRFTREKEQAQWYKPDP